MLTYSGTLPFLASVLLQLFFADLVALDYQYILIAYGAVITSFIAGVHWGIYLNHNPSINLFIHSNIIALMAWLALLIPVYLGFILLIICFLYLFLIDRKLAQWNFIEPWFIRLRLHATSVVVLSLIVNTIIVI